MCFSYKSRSRILYPYTSFILMRDTGSVKEKTIMVYTKSKDHSEAEQSNATLQDICGWIDKETNNAEWIQHVLGYHIGKTDQELMDRASESKRPASAFRDRVTVSEVLQAVRKQLHKDAGQIRDWINSQKGAKCVVSTDIPYPFSIGHLYLAGPSHHWNEGPIQCDRILIILRKNLDKGFSIRSVYPVASDRYYKWEDV